VVMGVVREGVRRKTAIESVNFLKVSVHVVDWIFDI